MADWGFETYAGDADRMIALIKSASGARNVFIAGHSQGGAFVSNYAGRLQADGKRGTSISSQGPSISTPSPPLARLARSRTPRSRPTSITSMACAAAS